MKAVRKAGGGFLHDTAGVIEGYAFESTKWGTGEDAYYSLSIRLDIRPDGADEAVPQFIPAGFFYPDNQTISEDGQTLTSDREGAVLQPNTEFVSFLESMEKAGFDVDGKIGFGNDLSALNGLRVQFVKAINEPRQLAAGAKKLGKAKAATATKDELMKAGRQQDKKDKTKFYNHQLLLVSEILAAPEAPAKGAAKKGAAPAAGKKAATPAAKAQVAAAKGKTAAKPAAAEEAAGDSEQADSVVLALLADAKDNTIERKGVSSLIVRYALKNSLSADDRESLRKQIHSEEYLNDAAERGIVSYDADAQTISLP